jgi:hypothetical protein
VPPDHEQDRDGQSVDRDDESLMTELRAVLRRADPVPAAVLAAARAAFRMPAP